MLPSTVRFLGADLSISSCQFGQRSAGSSLTPICSHDLTDAYHLGGVTPTACSVYCVDILATYAPSPAGPI